MGFQSFERGTKGCKRSKWQIGSLLRPQSKRVVYFFFPWSSLSTVGWLWPPGIVCLLIDYTRGETLTKGRTKKGDTFICTFILMVVARQSHPACARRPPRAAVVVVAARRPLSLPSTSLQNHLTSFCYRTIVVGVVGRAQRRGGRGMLMKEQHPAACPPARPPFVPPSPHRRRKLETHENGLMFNPIRLFPAPALSIVGTTKRGKAAEARPCNARMHRGPRRAQRAIFTLGHSAQRHQ